MAIWHILDSFLKRIRKTGDEFFKANPKAVKVTVKGINFMINSIRRNENIFSGFGSLKPNFDSRVNKSDILNKIRIFVENYYAY